MLPLLSSSRHGLCQLRCKMEALVMPCTDARVTKSTTSQTEPNHWTRPATIGTQVPGQGITSGFTDRSLDGPASQARQQFFIIHFSAYDCLLDAYDSQASIKQPFDSCHSLHNINIKMSAFKSTELFGGALIADLPTSFSDVRYENSSLIE